MKGLWANIRERVTKQAGFAGELWGIPRTDILFLGSDTLRQHIRIMMYFSLLLAFGLFENSLSELFVREIRALSNLP